MNQSQLSTALIGKWRTVLDAGKHIFTWTGDGELCWLAEQSAKCQQMKIAEIGTHFGRSAKMMLDASQGSTVLCVDPFLYDGTEMTARYFLREEVALGRCEIKKERAFVAAYEFKGERQFDMVFLDGGHEEWEVADDIKVWLPLVRPGGLLCGHDMRNETFPGVLKAVEKLLPGYTEPVKSIWAYIKPA